MPTISVTERRAKMKSQLQREVREEVRKQKGSGATFEQRAESPSRRKLNDVHRRSLLANTKTGITISPHAPKGAVRKESIRGGTGTFTNIQSSETVDDNRRPSKKLIAEPRKDSVRRRIRGYVPEPSNTKNPVPRSMSLGSSPARHKTSTEINESRTGKRRSSSITSQSSGNIIGHSMRPQPGRIFGSSAEGSSPGHYLVSSDGQLRGRRWASTPRKNNNTNIVEHRSPNAAWGETEKGYHTSIRPSSRIRCTTPGEDNKNKGEIYKGKRCNSPVFDSVQRNHGNVISHNNTDGSNPPPHSRNLKGCLAAPPVFVPESISFNPAIHRKQSPCSYRNSDVLNTKGGTSSDPFLGITGKPSSTPNGSPRTSRGRGCFSPIITTDPITHRLLEC